MPLPTVGVRRALGGAVAAVVACVAVGLGAPAASASPAAASHRGVAAAARGAASPARDGTLELESQSPWVTPGSPFTVKVLLPAGAPAAGAVDVRLTVYDHLTARSTFEATLSGTPAGGLLDTAGPAPPTAVDGRAVSFTAAVITSPSAVSPSLDLHCEPGSCSGVYPLAVSVTAADSGRSLGHLLTYLSYDELDLTTAGQAVGPQALRVAWVVPFDASDAIGGTTSDPASSTAPPRAATSAMATLAAQLSSSGVPVTVEASGRTVQALATSGGAQGRDTVAALGALSAGTLDEFPTTTYVPVDAGALAGRGLTGEVQLEMARGSGLLAQYRIHAHGGSYVVTGDAGQDLGSAIAPLAAGAGVSPGALLVVVPDSDLAAASTDPLTFSQPFTLDAGGRSVTAAASDGHLAAHFAAAGADPVLAANQLLADLAFIHFEEPSVDYPRGVVMVPPAGWTPQSAFDSTLLHGLAHNPVVEPVTLDQYFATVPAHTAVTTGTRRLATGGAGPLVPLSLTHAIANERLRISGFESAAGAAGGATGTLADDLLAAESSSLRPAGQSQGVATTDRALRDQLAHITLSTESTITLTARNEPIPVTVLSTAPYNVTARLTLSSDKFVFAAPTRKMVLDRAANPVRVNAVARTSGDLPVEVTVTSPKFGLVMAHELLTVRSTATSSVGVLLTVLALAVLLVWWARTVWRGRGRRRAQRES